MSNLTRVSSFKDWLPKGFSLFWSLKDKEAVIEITGLDVNLQNIWKTPCSSPLKLLEKEKLLELMLVIADYLEYENFPKESEHLRKTVQRELTILGNKSSPSEFTNLQT